MKKNSYILILGLFLNLSAIGQVKQELTLQEFYAKYCSVYQAPASKGKIVPNVTEIAYDWHCSPIENKDLIDLPYEDWGKNRDRYLNPNARAAQSYETTEEKREIKYIVLHNTEELLIDALGIFSLGLPFRSILSDLDLKEYKNYRTIKNRIKQFSSVSIHYVVGRDGTLIKNIDTKDVAFHSGSRTINSQSIGIEIEAGLFNDVARIKAGGMTAKQESRLVELVKHLQKQFKIPTSRIIHHRHVSGTECPKSIFEVSENGVDSFWAWRDQNFRKDGEVSQEQLEKNLFVEIGKVRTPEAEQMLAAYQAEPLNLDLSGYHYVGKAAEGGAVDFANILNKENDCLANTWCVDVLGSPAFLFDSDGNRREQQVRKVVSYLYCSGNKIEVCSKGCVRAPPGNNDHCLSDEYPNNIKPVDIYSSLNKAKGIKN